MKVTIIGAGNSGIAMAAHLSQKGNQVTLWNRSYSTVEKLIKTHIIRCKGVIEGDVFIDCVTNDINIALEDPDIILISTPANSHRELAELIAKNIKKSTVIVLNPGRTFGALEFRNTYEEFNNQIDQIIAETQTIIYTCRKTDEDGVDIIALKENVPISSLDIKPDESMLDYLPNCLKKHFVPARSMIQTSIGNVGMVLHCAPLLLNTGWTENEKNIYKYYFDGITPTVGELIEKVDRERVAVSEALGCKVETTKEWLMRTYNVSGNNIYECIQNNEVYKTIYAPESLQHRYIFEDVPCGLVPLEALGLKLDIDMTYTSLIIDLASKLLETDFRKTGRNLEYLHISSENDGLKKAFESRFTYV